VFADTLTKVEDSLAASKESKICLKCKTVKLRTEFHKRNSDKYKLQAYCKLCRKEIQNNYENTEIGKLRRREAGLKHKYKMSLQQYLEKAMEQNYCCAICGLHESNFKNPLSVDHDHNTGKIRGLLCQNCNKGIGNLKESIQNFQQAIWYLQEYSYEES